MAMRRQGDRRGNSEDRALYIISIAAELAGVHPQTLRIYERKGLLSPARTAGNTRRYSNRDIERLRMIQRLTQEHGVNLAGVKMIVDLENELDRLRRQLQRMDRELERARHRTQDEAGRTQPRGTEIVPVSTIRRLRLQVRPNERRGPIAVGPGS
ncbi:MAG TPA: helix-turn-helix transcriptional regulator [Actinomycetota bacterium]|nr:helix-turn-helix transcriptional regulator [Actinomycetota bacterium]